MELLIFVAERCAVAVCARALHLQKSLKTLHITVFIWSDYESSKSKTHKTCGVLVALRGYKFSGKVHAMGCPATLYTTALDSPPLLSVAWGK